MMSSLKAKAYGVGLTVASGVGLLAMNAHAAADADVVSTTGAIATTVQENMLAVITANVPVLIIVGVLVVSIGLIWRLSKRFASGR